MEFTKDIKFNNSPKANSDLAITYNGFLSNSPNLWITYGYGENWANTTEDEMKKTENGFVANIKIDNFDTFNFCFRNGNQEWDNNFGFNFITPILPEEKNEVNVQEIQNLFDEILSTDNTVENVQAFDIDALIEEILQPIATHSENEQDNTPVQIQEKPIDLGYEVSTVLSQIDEFNHAENLVEVASTDEILAGTIIEETPVELFEEPVLEKSTPANQNIETSQEPDQNALINVDNTFTISPRKLSKFYLWRKKIKLAFYKALIKLPKLIFGVDEQ